MDSTMPDRGLPLSLWGIWWNAILLLRPAFSRLRTFMWFATAVAGLTVRLELLGVTSMMAESDAERYLRRTGWLKLYRSDAGFAATARERAIAAEIGIPLRVLDMDAARALEPSLAPVFS